MHKLYIKQDFVQYKANNLNFKKDNYVDFD